MIQKWRHAREFDCMEPDNEGRWVLWEDHIADRVQLIEDLRAELRKIKNIVNNIEVLDEKEHPRNR